MSLIILDYKPKVHDAGEIIQKWVAEQFVSQPGFAIWYPSDSSIIPELESIVGSVGACPDNSIVLLAMWEDDLVKIAEMKVRLKRSQIPFSYYRNGKVVEEYEPTYTGFPRREK